jgi:hypothetical protein
MHHPSKRSITQVQMNISVTVIPSEVEGPRETALGNATGSFDFAVAPLRMTTTAPDRPGTGTTGKSSRARNILRRLQRFV